VAPKRYVREPATGTMPMTGVQKMCKLPNLATEFTVTMATVISSLVAVLAKLLQSPEDRNSNRPPVSKTTRCPVAQNSSVLAPLFGRKSEKTDPTRKSRGPAGRSTFYERTRVGMSPEIGRHGRHHGIGSSPSWTLHRIVPPRSLIGRVPC
jgi:hypothetical protein